METEQDVRVTLIGTGTIGLSFAAFYLSINSPPTALTIYDTRPSLKSHLKSSLPKHLPSIDSQILLSRINIASTLEAAVSHADIIQESGPENLAFKQSLWPTVEAHCSPTALLWSSTSGIPASQQSRNMRDPSRLLVVHPYNPPHIMPLLELVPSPDTSPSVVKRTQEFWEVRGRRPITIHHETTGFVANRLAFALFREACHLVSMGVVSVAELDGIVEASMGPRWAIAGPFKSYAAGGGEGGLEGFLKNVGGTVQACWEAQGSVDIGVGDWESVVCGQVREAYGGVVDGEERDRLTRRVLEVVGEEKGRGKGQ